MILGNGVIKHLKSPVISAYITPETNLRSSHKDPLTFESLIKPRITKKYIKNCKDSWSNRKNLKTKGLKVKKKVKTIKRRKKKPFKKYRARENIYTDDKNITDEFGENKVLTTSFFYRTHIQWNNLPLEVKIIENYDKFKIRLEEHLWDYIMECEDHTPNLF